MTAQFARGAIPGLTTGPHHEPHAALLIDFDNVTMGIRSDLTKELKSLLNSDIIKGKVAVQRAYADWRRYPQYIVPLAEASVDLIFAPAYGSSKKNATDIRLAIDALELVFTRSEIGTYILLSGDSDFSSLVLKLKEYGKYVIGVGIRESASDLLVQNCDEYYSYSALTGLTRASEQIAAAGHDPWELVDTAVRKMIAQGDVMRSDRLKQVILELDSNFDEKTLGFSKFNRFVQEAASRGLLRLHKMENGQFEVALPDGEAAPSGVAAVAEESGDGRRGRGRRGRGRRPVEPQPSVNGAETHDEPAAPRAESAQPAEPPTVEAEPAAPVRVTEPLPTSPDDLTHAYDLLRRATEDVATTAGGPARDSDVKRRMLEIQKDWDESACGFSKFSRFLRQAHDAGVIDLHRLDNGNYDVSLIGVGDAVREARPSHRAAANVVSAPVPATADLAADASSQRGKAARGASAKPVAEAAPTTPTTPASSSRQRRKVERAAPIEPVAEAVSATPASSSPKRGEVGREAPAEPVTRPASAAEPVPAESVVTARARGVRPRSGSRGRAAPAAPPDGQAVAAVRAAELPSTPDDVIAYLMSRYKGVGRRSGEMLVEAFGAANVFNALDTQPERIREILGTRRGDKLVEAWRANHAGRPVDDAQAGHDPDSAHQRGEIGEGEFGSRDAAEPVESVDELRARPRRSRGRRGGRRRAASSKQTG